MRAVELLTIKSKLPLFKGEEEANAIELIQFEEVGFEVVSQKNLYNIGDKAVYVMPDFCLSDIELFESFIRPNGDPKKSRLGSKNRVRAIKFNFHRGDNKVVYSEGIIMPVNEVKTFLNITEINQETDLAVLLNITKWEEPEDRSGSGLNNGGSKPFPNNMYKTDEDNINKGWNSITYPFHAVGRIKEDGSSITLYAKNMNSDNPFYGITSRNLAKPLMVRKVVSHRNPTLFERFKSIFGYKPDLKVYDDVMSDSDFVIAGLPYLEKLMTYCSDNNLNIALRGELNGGGAKGSGNKNNPASKRPLNIKFFGADWYDFNTVKMDNTHFTQLAEKLELPVCDLVFDKVFNSKEEIVEECERFFEKNMVEGIVIRSLDSTVSFKYMNKEYDSKK